MMLVVSWDTKEVIAKLNENDAKEYIEELLKKKVRATYVTYDSKEG